MRRYYETIEVGMSYADVRERLGKPSRDSDDPALARHKAVLDSIYRSDGRSAELRRWEPTPSRADWVLIYFVRDRVKWKGKP